MQMLCKVSNVFSDVRCPVCGQGFLVYWTRIASMSRDEQRTFLLNGLRGHHSVLSGTDAHAPAFYLSDGAPVLPFDDPAGIASPSLHGMYS